MTFQKKRKKSRFLDLEKKRKRILELWWGAYPLHSENKVWGQYCELCFQRS